VSTNLLISNGGYGMQQNLHFVHVHGLHDTSRVATRRVTIVQIFSYFIFSWRLICWTFKWTVRSKLQTSLRRLNNGITTWYIRVWESSIRAGCKTVPSVDTRLPCQQATGQTSRESVQCCRILSPHTQE